MADSPVASPPFRVGLISDTHGLLRPEALSALRDVHHIIHAGDIGDASILEQLSDIAAVTAIRGNNDKAEWAHELPDAADVELSGVRIHVLHDMKELGRYPAPAGTQVIVAGHSHQPGIRNEFGVLHVNPGSAGPRRFRLSVTVAVLQIQEGKPQAEIIRLL